MSKQQNQQDGVSLPHWSPFVWKEGSEATVTGTPYRKGGSVSDPGFTIELMPLKSQKAPNVALILRFLTASKTRDSRVEVRHRADGYEKILAAPKTFFQYQEPAEVAITFDSGNVKITLNGTTVYTYPTSGFEVKWLYVHGEEFTCDSITPP